MKLSIWDILTGITLVATVCMVFAIGAVLLNPGMAGISSSGPEVIHPLEPTIAIPTATPTTIQPTATDAPAGSSAGGENQPANPPPGLRPSSTPIPTNTPFVLPTFTPVKPTSSASGGGGTSGRCAVTYQDPRDESVLSPGMTFTTRWTIKNTSSDTWRGDSVDIRFSGGERLQTGPDAYDLPQDIKPQDSVDVFISMQAPSTKGDYVSNWGVYEGSTNLCRFYLKITVR